MKTISCNNEMTVKNRAALPKYWMVRSRLNTPSNNNMPGKRLFFFLLCSLIYMNLQGSYQHSQTDRYLQNERGIPTRLKWQQASPSAEK